MSPEHVMLICVNNEAKGKLVVKNFCVFSELQCKSDGEAVLRFGIRGKCNLLEFPVYDRMFPLIPACAIRNPYSF
jgi:hypothetical protein